MDIDLNEDILDFQEFVESVVQNSSDKIDDLNVSLEKVIEFSDSGTNYEEVISIEIDGSSRKNENDILVGYFRPCCWHGVRIN